MNKRGVLMIINSNDIENCLKFFAKKYDIFIENIEIIIDDKLNANCLLNYQNRKFNVHLSLIIDYRQKMFVLKDIEGYVKYGIIEIPVINIAKQFLYDKVIIEDNSIKYDIELPIKTIEINKNIILETE
jgi:hypothetical protein